MSEEEARKIIKSEFENNIKINLDSAIIFTYIQMLEQENTQLKEQLEKIQNEPLTDRRSRIDSVLSNIYRQDKQLQNNWNELKKWLEEEKPTEDMNENFIVIRLSDLKNKMQELENRKV